MEDSAKFRRYVAVVVVMIVLGAAFVVLSGVAGADNWASAMSVFVLVTMAVVATLVAVRWSKEMKAGFPRYDERSIAIRMRAGYLAFFVSIYLLLGAGFALSVIDEDAVASVPTPEWFMIFVAVMGMIFLAFNAYLGRKGVPG
jgi:drug/metabolite transporter (DMT)-like permease